MEEDVGQGDDDVVNETWHLMSETRFPETV